MGNRENLGKILWFCAPHSVGPDNGLAEKLARDFSIVRVRSIAGITQAVASSAGAVVFLDFECPSREGLQLLLRIKEKHPSLPIFFFTSFTSEELAVWAFRAGVRDYFVKPIAVSRVTEKVGACMALLRQQGKESRSIAWKNQSMPMPVVTSNGSDERKLQAACRYIEKYYHRKIALNEVADLVSMSAFQLCRLFRRGTGSAFKEYLVRYRLIRAETLLLGTSASITEIACAVGFGDSSNFQRLFRKKNGVTPSEYRKNNNAELLSQEAPAGRSRQQIVIGATVSV